MSFEAGLSRAEFWELSWYEFRLAIEAMNARRKHDFNVMRHHASLTMIPHVGKSDRSKLKPNRLLPLEGDIEVDKPTMTEQEAMNILQFFDRKLIDMEEI